MICLKICKTMTWQHEVTGIEGEVILFGINIFEYEWHRMDENVSVQDPLYHQNYRFPIYTVKVNGVLHKFAAGEFSNSVWGFYLFKY